MSDNYLRHRRGGRGFYEELPSDSEEEEDENYDEFEEELDPVEAENLAEMEEEGDFDEIPDVGEIPDLEDIPHGNPFDLDNFPHLRDDLELLPIPENIQGLIIYYI